MKPLKRDPQLVQAYKLEHPYCEVLGCIQGKTWEQILKSRLAFHKCKYPEDLPLELHHIYGGTSNRFDLWGNIIHISTAAHEYCHTKPCEGKVACLYAKHIKGDLTEEAIEQLQERFLLHPIGRLDSMNVTEKWAKDMRAELLQEYLP